MDPNTKKNYKKQQKIMKDENIKNKWKNFINKYNEFFKSKN